MSAADTMNGAPPAPESGTPKRLTVNDLQQRLGFEEREIELPELGGSILVRGLSAGKRSRLLNGLMDDNGQIRDYAEMAARQFAAAVVDPKVTVVEARMIQEMWPREVWDRVIDVLNDMNPQPQEVVRVAADEFPPADD